MDGSVFEGCRLALGKALTLILCWAQVMTYEQAVQACKWSDAEPAPCRVTAASVW